MEFIILQPLATQSKDLNVSLIQRRHELTPEEESSILHEGDGQYEGFVIKKSMPQHMQSSLNLSPCHLLCKLKLYMKHSSNSETRHERRTLQFWFSTPSEKERSDCYNTFLRSLLKPDNFPKDYFTFLLKIMLIFKELKATSLLKIDIEKLDDQSAPSTPMSLKDPKQYAAIVTGKILEYLERSFPNMLSVTELARLTETPHEVVYEFLRDLYSRGLVKYFDNGNSWMRNIINSQEDQTHDVIMVQNQPKVSPEDQPTIAIITVNYYEKLAVDAMMTNKVTFVRHKADGESNVYTIGVIGEHRVVTTKLPLLNRDIRSAKISSGNSTTRLLGNFQKVEHVILVGCAGGVPHYSDHSKHPRRGDIIVSYPESSNDTNDEDDQNFVYAHFEIEKNSTNSRIVSKTWTPSSIKMYKIVNRIRKTYDTRLNQLYPWEGFLQDGIKALTNDELDCQRPAEDKLFFTVGEKNIIEVDHPIDETNSRDRQRYGLPTLRFGKIGAGDSIVKDETLRYRVSELNGIMCYDNDLDQVMEAIEGSRKESFIIIRGIADYVDGTTTKEWQPYAALSAAAFAKTLICELPATPPSPN